MRKQKGFTTKQLGMLVTVVAGLGGCLVITAIYLGFSLLGACS